MELVKREFIMNNMYDNYVSPLGLDVKTLESSFALLAPQGEALVARFYEELFKRYPAVIPLFEHTTPQQQQTKLLAALQLVIQNVRNPDALGAALTAMGERHQGYGAEPAHYGAVASTLIDVMKEFAGVAWTDQIEQAWTHALNTVAKVMTDAYKSTDAQRTPAATTTEVAAMNSSIGGAMDNNDQSELDRLRSAVGGAMQAMMMIDRDFNITYTNQATIDMLTKHEHVIRNAFPGFSVVSIIGTCIDQFHKNPAHQRQMLSNYNNLPYSTDIQVGPLSFKLNVTAMMSATGEYIGNSLEWADITDELAKENHVSRLQGSVDGSMQATIMVDRDFNITYANDATVSLMSKYNSQMVAAFPGVDFKNLIGVCIDAFHKNPAHQRQLLSDPSSCPYQTDIQIGDLSFSLNVTATMDSSGTHVGNSLEWADVTDLRARENHVARLQGSVDGSMQAMMMVDRDFVITYANQSSIDLLNKYQMQLSSAFPGVNFRNVIGTCIDVFHKNPSHQRQMLADPNNCPYQTDIEIGDLKFSLNVTATMDASGVHVGNSLEWNDVTEARKKELEVARLQSAVDGAQANLMICDTDLVITYANPAVIKMMGNRNTELRATFPGFDANNLVGQCIDQFHRNPAHQRQLLGNAANLPVYGELKVGGLEFSVNATAILDHQGNLMGNMVEWGDITEQKDAEGQIQNLIDTAVLGQLDTRIDASSYQGFMKGLADGINQLMDAVVAPLRSAQEVISALAEGDLTIDMEGEYHGAFAELKEGLNETVGNLSDMVDKILDGAENIVTSSDEISKGNTDLSQRTEEQASSLEETASSMEEMTSTVKQNADNAREANQLASAARDQAEKGGDVVQSAVTAMSEINSSSKKIADIIGVIDEIAFQTNLLALNAAVEAARAGEQGRGFAVVAGEVRNLAQRSAGAAKEIKGLISDSVDKVDEGSRLVDESGKTLNEIVNSVKKVSDIISEIAAASTEQSAGIEEVNKAISQMDEMTQQNAALVEEATAAGEAMNEEAKTLDELMQFFNLDEAEPEPVKRAPKKRRRRSAVEETAPAEKKSTRSRRKAKPVEDEDDEWEEF